MIARIELNLWSKRQYFVEHPDAFEKLKETFPDCCGLTAMDLYSTQIETLKNEIKAEMDEIRLEMAEANAISTDRITEDEILAVIEERENNVGPEAR